MAKSPEEMADSMVANMKEKTGKTLPAWLKIVAASGCEKHGQIVKSLKTEHGVTHGYANLVAHHFLADGKQDVDLVGAQYAGPKEALRPIYDKLIAEVSSWGDDIEVSPKKSYVSLRRNKQFALIQPSTKTRVDVGVQLKGREPEGRLESSGSFNQMVSHRVRVSSAEEVDADLLAWLKAAYEAG